MAGVEAELRQFRAFLEASERLLQAATLQDELTLVAKGVVDSGLFSRCLVSIYHHQLTEEALVGGAGIDAGEVARLRRQPSISREWVHELEVRGTPLGTHCYYIPAHLLGSHPAVVPSSRTRDAFVDWHPDDMFLATLWSGRGQLFGFLTADDPPDGRIPTPDSVRTLVLFADLASDLLEREFALRRDGLTGMYNGTFLDEVLAELDSPPLRTFGALYADLDNLKVVNDRFGHRVGDQYILAAARILREAVDPQVLWFRPYGDEFIAIAKDADILRTAPERIAAAVSAWNERERLSLLSLAASEDDQPAFRLGMCAGEARRDGDAPARDVVVAAEERMYEHKRLVHQGDDARRRRRYAPPTPSTSEPTA